jgi:hypothetical protein
VRAADAAATVLLCGLLLFAMAARPEIQRIPRMRRLHMAAAVLTAVLLEEGGLTSGWEYVGGLLIVLAGVAAALQPKQQQRGR